MEDLCVCESWKVVKNRELFKKHPTYGWIISWIELTEEKGYTQRHNYGISISFCPMCGGKLKDTNGDPKNDER